MVHSGIASCYRISSLDAIRAWTDKHNAGGFALVPFAMTLTLGLSYTMTQDGHVRVDFLYQHYSPRTKSIVDVIGIALFVIPLYAFLLWHGWDYTQNSMSINESSPNPGGMPWLWIVKGLLPLSSLLLLIESVARIVLILNNRQNLSTEVHGS